MKKLLDLLISLFSHASSKKSLETKSNQKPEKDLTMVFSCNEKDTGHLDSLCRYYETGYEGVIARGIWLATLMRDSEIDNKNLAIVDIDKESGKVISVSPVTLC